MAEILNTVICHENSSLNSSIAHIDKKEKSYFALPAINLKRNSLKGFSRKMRIS